MKRRNKSQRESRDLTYQDIQAHWRKKTWCSRTEDTTQPEPSFHCFSGAIQWIASTSYSTPPISTVWGTTDVGFPHHDDKQSFSFWRKWRNEYRARRPALPGSQYVTFPWGHGCSGAAGFHGHENYFWLAPAGSDVTSVSSSSGLGSSLAPEILLSLPVVLGEVEEVWSQQMRRGGQEGVAVVGLSVASLTFNTIVFL